jgi:hypothetical protein
MRYAIEESTANNGGYYYRALGPCFMMVRLRPTRFLMFHQHCYSLLLRHFEGEKIDLDRLWVVGEEICRTHFLYEGMFQTL